MVLGDDCYVGEHAVINPGVKIYPFKTVEAGALVTSSIVWESKGARTLFGRRGVHGLANVDITSEVAVRLEPQKIEKRLAMTPPVWKLESTFKLKRNEKQKVVAERRIRLAEENCLAKAVYFEARSESELGQLAVAKVILNRVKDPNYPKTICGVVYQGSDRRNSCQFSFACDGVADDVKNQEAWDHSKLIAQKAIAGDQTIRIIGAATNYHADYVSPKWAKDMRKLIKIGRHIFYSDS